MTVDRPLEQLARVADLRPSEWIRARSEPAPERSARYGEDRRARWPLLLFICLAHAAGLFLLASAVLHPNASRRLPPLRITLVPVEAAPTAAPKPAPEQPVRKRETPPPVIAATPVVPVATAAPVVVAPVPEVAPPAPAPEPATSSIPSPAPAPAPAPLIPPDGQAATLHNPAPVYPMEARRKRQQGTVRLRVTISADGRVEEIAVSRTSGFDLLDQAALDAVRRWKFVPGSRGGVPVEAVGSLSIPFKLV